MSIHCRLWNSPPQRFAKAGPLIWNRIWGSSSFLKEQLIEDNKELAQGTCRFLQQISYDHIEWQPRLEGSNDVFLLLIFSVLMLLLRLQQLKVSVESRTVWHLATSCYIFSELIFLSSLNHFKLEVARHIAKTFLSSLSCVTRTNRNQLKACHRLLR